MNAIIMNAMKKLAIPLLVAVAYGPAQGLAVPILGTDLASFAVLGASAVTNTGPTTLDGNLGVYAGSSITGGPPLMTITAPYTVHATDAVAQSAQGQLTTAINSLGLLGPGTLLPADLTGLTIFPGVFTVPAGTNLSGLVTLDGLGNADALWVFQMPSTLITASGSVVNVINSGANAGVFWNVGTSATLGSGSTFEGNILAHTSISLDSAATIGCGRALANTGAVTMNNNTIGIECGTGEVAGYSGSNLNLVFEEVGNTTVRDTAGNVVSGPGAFASVPEPGTLVLLGFGLAGLFPFRKRLFPVA